VQCFVTFRGFLHKIYAATVDGKGREGTYNFFSRRLGGCVRRTKIFQPSATKPLRSSLNSQRLSNTQH